MMHLARISNTLRLRKKTTMTPEKTTRRTAFTTSRTTAIPARGGGKQKREICADGCEAREDRWHSNELTYVYTRRAGGGDVSKRRMRPRQREHGGQLGDTRESENIQGSSGCLLRAGVGCTLRVALLPSSILTGTWLERKPERERESRSVEQANRHVLRGRTGCTVFIMQLSRRTQENQRQHQPQLTADKA